MSVSPQTSTKPLERWLVLSQRADENNKIGLVDWSFIARPQRVESPSRFVPECDGRPVDLFHRDVPFHYIDGVFALMALCPQHTFQIATRNAARMALYFAARPVVETEGLPEGTESRVHEIATTLAHERFNRLAKSMEPGSPETHALAAKTLYTPAQWPLQNVWLGIRAVNQIVFDERIVHLLTTPAAVRFVQFDPLVGAVDISAHLSKQPFFDALGSVFGRVLQEEAPRVEAEVGIDWVVVRGEHESDAERDLHEPRPLHPAWVTALRDECQAAVVPFCFEGWGEWLHDSQTDENLWGKLVTENRVRGNVNNHTQYGGSTYRVGSEHAGRLLDGRVWDEMPQAAAGEQI